MNDVFSHKPNTYSYREVNNNMQHIKFCTCVEKLQLHNFILIIFINLHSFSNTTILNEENNSLHLKVLTLLQQ